MPERVGRVEFRLADTVPFKGSEATPRKHDAERVFVAETPVVTSADLSEVSVVVTDLGMPALHLRLCAEGGRRLAQFTVSNRGRLMAIVIGKRVLSVPRIVGRVERAVEVGGGLTMEEAQRMARDIRNELPATRCASAP